MIDNLNSKEFVPARAGRGHPHRRECYVGSLGSGETHSRAGM